MGVGKNVTKRQLGKMEGRQGRGGGTKVFQYGCIKGFVSIYGCCTGNELLSFKRMSSRFSHIQTQVAINMQFHDQVPS